MASHADLVDCAKRGFAEDIGAAIKGGADVNKRDEDDIGNTLLHWSAAAGHVAVVEALLAGGADANATNRKGDTPLHAAAWRGQDAVIPLLLGKGADATVRNGDGKTASALAKTVDTKALVEQIAKGDLHDPNDSDADE